MTDRSPRCRLLSSRAALALASWVLCVSTLQAQIPFEPLVEIALPDGAIDAELADLDGDLALDLLITPSQSSFFPTNLPYDVLSGNGDGTFGAPVQGASLGTQSVGRGEVVDLDGDGDLEWVIPNGEQPGNAIVLAGSGGLVFGPAAAHGTSPATSGGVAKVVDLLGDDDHLDVILLGLTGPFDPNVGFVALVADGLGGFTQFPGQPMNGGPHSLAVGDVNADGLLDVLVSQSISGFTVSLYLATSATSWGPPTELAMAGGATPYDIELVDVDGGGELDLLVAHGGGGLSFFAGNGDGTFDPPTVTSLPASTQLMEVGDLDGDGELDVALSQTDTQVASDGSILILRGAGDGSFTLVNSLEVWRPLGLDLGDVDGDGDLDIAVAIDIGILFGPDSVGLLINRSYPAGSPFTDLGTALEGTDGLPIQLAEGQLTPGTPVLYELLGAVPGGTAFAVVGLSEINAAFKGGVLVPDADFVFGVPVDGTGRSALAGNWPAGVPSATTFTTQWWFDDAGAVSGKAGSNAIRTVVP